MMRRNMRRFTGVEPVVIDSALVDGAPTRKRRARAAFPQSGAAWEHHSARTQFSFNGNHIHGIFGVRNREWQPFISRTGILIPSDRPDATADLLRKSHSVAPESADCQKNFIKSLCPPKFRSF
jgi:hypothetical protein